MTEIDDIRKGVGFFKEFVEWIESLVNKEKRKHLGAIRAIHKAATDTNSYLSDLRDNKESNKEKERELSLLWYEAMEAIQPINPELAEKCLIKGQCWSDPRLFHSEKYQVVPLSIDYIFSETRKILNKMP
ncbi:MAG: hypothetical protein MI799_07475 [Desulfobacterales bacterium]|nr:hypothetical protein [Desulfobacterales bacterium]